MKLNNNKHGFTLMEVLVALGLLSVISSGSMWMLTTSLRSQSTVWDQLDAQGDGRKSIQKIVDDVRRAEYSSIGAYPIEIATTNTLIFYANVDADGFRERVHYWLVGRTLKRGIIKPSGNPLQYSAQNETTQDIAHDVANTSTTLPLFLYYSSSFAGTGTPLAQPVSTTAITLIKTQLEIEKNPDKSPVPVRIEGSASIRSLKVE